MGLKLDVGQQFRQEVGRNGGTPPKNVGQIAEGVNSMPLVAEAAERVIDKFLVALSRGPD
jgi:hypothetical protein